MCVCSAFSSLFAANMLGLPGILWRDRRAFSSVGRARRSIASDALHHPPGDLFCCSNRNWDATSNEDLISVRYAAVRLRLMHADYVGELRMIDF